MTLRFCATLPAMTNRRSVGQLPELAITVSPQVARRFILGKQGLWPGRRWSGKRGTEQAMRAMEHVQLDPLQIVARSHDIKLHSRVADYTPGLWETLTYQERKFFDWGGWLAVRPMEELPHWRVLMQRNADYPRIQADARAHAAAIDEMRQVLRERETVSNRDFEMKDRVRVNSYRGRKDSAIALHYLWRVGEVMVHHRERFERVYALAERVAPKHLLTESSAAEADRFMIKKLISFMGLSKWVPLSNWLDRTVGAAENAAWRQTLLAESDIVAVQVDGWKDTQYALTSDLPQLRELNAGRLPKAWKPTGNTTDDEVTFLAPLDVVSARGRAKTLFGFDYIWEVYKPVHLRTWGYYTLPILWKDELVARIDLKLDRSTSTLVICGFWLEQAATGKDAQFGEALARGTARFMRFVQAAKMDAKAVQPVALRKVLMAQAETRG